MGRKEVWKGGGGRGERYVEVGGREEKKDRVGILDVFVFLSGGFYGGRKGRIWKLGVSR